MFIIFTYICVTTLNCEMKFGLHIILYILIFFSCLCCKRKGNESDQEDYRDRFLIREILDSVSVNPLQASNLLDSLLVIEKDSVTYYELLVVKAKAMMFLSKHDSSEILLNRAEDFYRRNKELPHIEDFYIQILNGKGNLFSRKTMFDSALVPYNQACRLCMKGGDKEKLVFLSLNLADAYLRAGHYDLSSYWYRYSLSLADSLQLPDEKRFPAYGGLGQVNMELRDFVRSDYYYDLAGKYYDRMTPHEKRFYLNNRGNSYYFREDYPSALTYFRRLMDFLQEYPEMTFERNITMVNLGDVFLSMGEIDSAAYYLDRCYNYFQKEENYSALYYIDTQLIELALKEDNVQLARKRLQNAVTPKYVEPDMVHIRNRYLQLYFEKVGDFKNAYYYQRENQRIDDSIRSERVKMRAAEIALKYKQDSTLMKKEILIREKQNEVLLLNQWLYRIVLIVVVLIAVSLFIVFYRKRKRDRDKWNMQQAMTSLRLENIRNRISPHFIFNVLNREVALQRTESDNLQNLIKIIRKNLEFTSHMAVTLADELDFVNTYIQLERRTLRNDFIYVEDIASDVDLKTVQVPSMLLQIPVENAIKHALRMKEGQQKLWIRIKKESEYIKIVICDNGGGYRLHSQNKGTGTGMKVLTQTIQLLNSYNRRQIVMTINNVSVERGEVGCEVCFTVPFVYSYQLKGK